MATGTLGKEIEIKNKGLLLLGAFLLVVGLIASFYHAMETNTILGGTPYQYTYVVDKGYPYQGIGAVLVIAGIVFVALGFLYPSQRMPPPPPPPQKA